MKNRKNYTSRYALIQSAYWMINSVLVSFAVVFLTDKGLSNSNIGVILALASLFAVIIQPVIASYIDKSDKITVRIGASFICFIAILMALLMLFLQKFIIAVPVLHILVYMFFATLQPLNSSLGMECEEYGNVINFGLARGLGSWAYAILTVIMGYYLMRFSPSTIPAIYLGLFIVLFILILTFKYEDVRQTNTKTQLMEEATETAHSNIIEFAKCYPEFMIFLIGTVLIFYGHMLVNNFAINIYENIGANSSDMGVGVGFSAFLELPAMVFVTKYKDKISVKTMLTVSAIAFSIRHLLFWVAPNVFMLTVAQGVQMLAYAVFAAASVYYINDKMGKRDAVKGQSYSITAITIGGIFSSLIGGAMIDGLGIKSAMRLGVVLTVIGSAIMIASLNIKKHNI